jgi:hypothetical protein
MPCSAASLKACGAADVGDATRQRVAWSLNVTYHLVDGSRSSIHW